MKIMQGSISVEMARETVDQDMISEYQKNGFVKVPNLITRECANAFREEAVDFIHGHTVHNSTDDDYAKRLNQHVNIWQRNEVLAELTKSPEIAAIAEQLSGVHMRLWHDHLLSKGPGNGLATEWHQDKPYWPFEGEKETISVWIALQDTPEEHGCMNFIPGSHKLDTLPSTSLGNSKGLYDVAPDLEYAPKVKIPLKAGDATFHHGRTAHMATPNLLEDWRIAHVTVYMEDGTRLRETSHIVTANYMAEVGELAPGDVLNQEWFPRLANSI